MARVAGGALLGAIAVVALGAPLGCMLVASADDLSEGCLPGEKPCGGECVSVSDVEYGCGSSACLPCVLAKATPVCSDQTEACAIATCAFEYEDCDELVANGCEVHVATSVDHCGACGAACPLPPRGTAACGSSTCYVRECEEGHGDCNRYFEDGCEVNLGTSEEHCGACDSPCSGAQECHDGECR